MSSIFGNQGTQNQNQSQGTGLFGSSTTQNQPQSTGLFGSSTTNQPQQPSGGLFGTQNQSSQGTGLFGSSTTNPPQQQSGGLFGSSTTQQGGGLFGNRTGQTQGTSLFGSQPQQQQGTSLFGGSTSQAQQQQGTSLFGGSTAQNASQQPGTSLFNQQPSFPNPNASLMPKAVPERSFAERTFQNPQQTHLSSILQSGLGANPSAFTAPALHSLGQSELARSRLASAGVYPERNEKSVYQQIETLVRKWDPNAEETLMQTYLYNAVHTSLAPYYYRNPDESESEWEQALAKKPAPIEGQNGENFSFVPVLVRGFRALGDRVELQAKAVNDFRARLHEMNNSLDAVMSKHQQNLTVRVENARRQHAALSQRCLRLAVKSQVLRNKGYPLDQAEEGLRKTLLGLEQQVLNPAFGGREEEIWARMVALRERARWLEEEGKRLGGQGEEQKQQGSGVSEEVVQKTKRILKDYDGQLVHLARELEEVKREFEEWREQRR